jgi:predicted secreted hydrolase
VTIPRVGLEADITTALAEQEIPSRFGPSYWEGAIDVNGTRGGGAVHGVGYLEMTGYGRGRESAGWR